MKNICLAALLLALSLLSPLPVYGESAALIADGITVQRIDLSGMTGEQAQAAIDTWFQDFSDRAYTLTYADGTTESYTLSEWGFTWDSGEIVEQILRLSNSRSLIRRFKTQMNLKYGKLYLSVPFHLNSEKVLDSLKKGASEHDTPCRNPILAHDSGGFRIESDSVDGMITDPERTLVDITNNLALAIYTDYNHTLESRVQVNIEKAEITSDQLMDITDELGVFSTNYGDSSKNRKNNIEVACSNLNGTILMPGEKLSVSKTIGSRTEENGYKIASQYSNGESEKAVGGGVCQVSTTVYNAVLLSELDINERHNHSMIVTYVDYAMDAAIAENKKDLVFTNNTGYPVYIEATANGKKLTIGIYGKDTRPENRTIKYVSKTNSKEYLPEDDFNIKYDKELPRGEEKITGTRRPEVYATLTKIVYIDGEESERIVMHDDHYQPSRKTKTIGTGPTVTPGS